MQPALRPTLEEAKKISRGGSYRRIPISCEMLSDFITPIEALRKLKNVSDHCYILESVESQEKFGRYTFLGYDPMLQISCLNGRMKVEDLTAAGRNNGQGDKAQKSSLETVPSRALPPDTQTAKMAQQTALSADQTFPVSHPGDCIRSILRDFRAPQLSFLPSFCGGLVGYFSYDYLKYSEPSLRLDAEDTEHFQDVDLMLFDKVICFDHFSQKIILIANMAVPARQDSVKTTGAARVSAQEADDSNTVKNNTASTVKDIAANAANNAAASNKSASNPVSNTAAYAAAFAAAYEAAVQTLFQMRDLLVHGTPKEEPAGVLKSEVRPLFDKETYMRMVEKAKHHIREGDIFQIVLSNRLEADFEGSLFDTYRVLRTLNPSPYMFYFSGTDVETAGASPETLVKLENGVLHTFPLAGTRPRGATEEEDKALAQGLLQDPKELAEHNMLVDLGRNDIGKISKFGTVVVEHYHQILRYSHVMHIGSTVRGVIRDDLDALDAVDSILPAGTLSGAPKLRACQLINDLENNKRGIYGGAIGYLDFTGNLDTCIGIRLAYHKNNKVFIRSGAGIVADSVPEKEYQECINKAQAVVTALKEAQQL